MVQLRVIEEEAKWIRAYRRALTLWSSQVADEAAIGSAGVYANAKLPGVCEANCIVGELGREQEHELRQYFAMANASVEAWYLPAGSGEVPGLSEEKLGVWVLEKVARELPQTHEELTIISARASFPHVREIAAAMRPGCDAGAAGEAAVSHLDDSRVDAVLLLRDGQAAGYGAVLSTGEAGFIMELFVRPELRGRGYGGALTGRVLDICARSLFREVYCAAPRGDAQAQSFAGHIGFVLAGETLIRARK